MNEIQMAMVFGLLLKLTLCVAGSFRGWGVWPWILWIGLEVGGGILLGVLHIQGLVSNSMVANICIGVGLIVLCSLIYMVVKRRYPIMSDKEFKAFQKQMSQ